jgi:hypothetical protein
MECRDFPCKLHYEEVTIYARETLDAWKDLIENPEKYFKKKEDR